MKSLLMLLGALCACTAATARPMVIEGQAVLPAYSEDFAFAGDELISTKSFTRLPHCIGAAPMGNGHSGVNWLGSAERHTAPGWA
jgi:hypothetical protein